MEERLYFESPKVKVTDTRVVFGHDTVLIDNITAVDTNLRVFTLYASFIFCVIALMSFILVNAYYSVLFIGAGFIWARWEYEHYIELMVTVGPKGYKIASSSLSSRNCIYKIADALSMSMADSRRRKQAPGLSETETMQLRRLLLKMEQVDISDLVVKPRKSAKQQAPEETAGGAVDV